MKKVILILLLLTLSLTLFATLDTSGFYKLDGETVLYAQNAVYNAEYQLYRADKDTYEYPVHGWYWFDTKELAYQFFDIELGE